MLLRARHGGTFATSHGAVTAVSARGREPALTHPPTHPLVCMQLISDLHRLGFNHVMVLLPNQLK